MRAWFRILEVYLTSQKTHKTIVFGNRNEDNLNISVSGSKFPSALKDACTINITNLTYDKMIEIIANEYYDVEVKAGYREGSVQTYFKGAVLYISNERTSRIENDVVILCSSRLVARYGQSRINLTLNSGINMYSAINYVCKLYGLPNSNISQSLKNDILGELKNINTNAAQFFEKLGQANENYVVNADESLNSLFTITKTTDNKKIIVLNNDTVRTSGGYPRITKDGVNLTILPLYNFMPGDYIKIDNGILDVSVSEQSGISKNNAYYMDTNGEYMIFQIDYVFQNRGPNFGLTLHAKSRKFIQNIIGK